MGLFNKELEQQVHLFFKELTSKIDNTIAISRTNIEATERIMRQVSSSVSSEVEGYMIDLYSLLVDKVKKDEFFKDPEHLNAFYRLNLREDLNNKYQFDIESIDAYKKGIQYKEINNIYTTVGAAAGTLTVGGILKYALTSVINIPFVVVIAGAIAVACFAFFTISKQNRKEYKIAVNRFLSDLENSILDWFVDIEVYFDKQVKTLY